MGKRAATPKPTPKAAKTKAVKPKASPQKKTKGAEAAEPAEKSVRELQSGFITSMTYKAKSQRPDATKAQQLLEAPDVC